MKLISLVNSGESLGKVVSLIITAYHSNNEFYNSFEKVIVFYGKNIIKSKNDKKITGITNSFLKYNSISYYNYSMNDLFISRKEILKKLVDSNKITHRQSLKLTNNKYLFTSLIGNLCWYDIFPDLERIIIKKLKSKYKNLEIVNLSQFDNIYNIINCIPHYQRYGKIYFYNRNGGTITKKISKLNSLSQLKNYEKFSIYYTYNVYIFLMLINFYIKNSDSNDIVLGYRLMKRFPRKTYDVAIDYLIKVNNKIIEEPSNIEFGKKLDEYMFCDSINERSMYAIYDLFFKFLDK